MRIIDYDGVEHVEDSDVLMIHTEMGTKTLTRKNMFNFLGLPFKLAVDENNRYGYINNDTNEFVRFVNPSGTLTVNEKGDYDVADYKWLNMNIPFDLSILVDYNLDGPDLCTCRNDDGSSDLWDGNTPEEGWSQGIVLPEGYKTLVVHISADDYIWSDDDGAWSPENYDSFNINLYVNPSLIAQANADWIHEYEVYDQYKINSNNKKLPVIDSITKSQDSNGWSVVKVFDNVPPFSILVPRFSKGNTLTFPKQYFGLTGTISGVAVRTSYDNVWKEIDVGITPEDFRINSIWTDGESIYYSYGDNKQYIFDKSSKKWKSKTWNGFTRIYGENVWTDGDDIYYSSGMNDQYVLQKETGTWEQIISSDWWNYIHGYEIWTDGENIYCSKYYEHYVFNKAARSWSEIQWSGEYPYFDGTHVWTDGDDIYYSRHDYNSYQEYEDVELVLDKTTMTWVNKNWNGLTKLRGNSNGSNVWLYKDTVYYSNEAEQYVLDKTTDTWIRQSWGVLHALWPRFVGTNVWTDGENLYCRSSNTNYILLQH